MKRRNLLKLFGGFFAGGALVSTEVRSELQREDECEPILYDPNPTYYPSYEPSDADLISLPEMRDGYLEQYKNR